MNISKGLRKKITGILIDYVNHENEVIADDYKFYKVIKDRALEILGEMNEEYEE